ncbi:MAG: 7,8-didemethyl-8-hydroxy-5-deazariboflavin synthase subunit CofG [Synechococcales bacterium]|nr:7,8-didemethyl-8-hydroxy-5-deazariboflavin synthase subunit CofG [Synechococcales bacterium]
MKTPSALENRQVTYSPAYTLVPTYECFNRCRYCNFRVDPGQDDWLSLEVAQQRLHWCRSQGVIEILILSGEVHPRSDRRSAWCQHLYDLGQLALDMGFLPHTNAGPLSYGEMAKLKKVNVSMGLMLEQMTPALLQTVHRHAPSKRPELRLQQLAWAGELGIPFTTGLLLGIGETEADWVETLGAIAHVHQQWGHIQEVILQPHRLGSRQSWSATAIAPEQLIRAVAIARELLPADITLQIPPNLVEHPDVLIACLDAGARDLGGLGPIDEVNPDYAHPEVAALAEVLAIAGYALTPRLPVYPHHDRWTALPLQGTLQKWRQSLENGPGIAKSG